MRLSGEMDGGEREERKAGRRFWRAGLGGHIIFEDVGYIYISSGINILFTIYEKSQVVSK